VVGRQKELDRIDRVLEAARQGRADALVLRGEVGIGKTVLLRVAAARADGFLRLTSTGVESESVMAYAGLLQLLAPLRPLIERVPRAQAAALEAALGWGAPDATGDRFLVAAATMSLLAAAAEASPVIVMIDDLHWLDTESASAVLFACRRLAYDAVATLLATRGSSPPGTTLDGIGVVDLAGLTAAEVANLMPTGTTAEVCARLVAGTHGNPLALRELAARLSAAQHRGAAPLPDPLPTGERLAAVYESLLADLSPECRRLVIVVAVALDDAVEPIVRAAGTTDMDPERALAEAEGRRILDREPGVVRFRHPLLRTSTLAAATASERRAAHAALAAALPATRVRARAWHRAESADGPDGDLADEIEHVAVEERERLGYAAASMAFERASRLSPDPARAATRLASAVEDAALAGDVHRARGLGERFLAGEPDRASRGRVLAALGSLEQYAGSVPRARHMLEQAVEDTDGRVRIWLLADLFQVCFRLDDFAGAMAAADRIAADADDSDPHQRALRLFVGGVVRLVGSDPEGGRGQLTASVELMDDDSELRDDLRFFPLRLLAYSWLPLGPDAVAPVERRFALARNRGALGVLVSCLALAAHGRAMLGDYDAAFAEAGEAVELAEELGYVADAAPALELLAWQHAARGFHDEAQAELARAAVFVDRARTAHVAAHLALARAFCALCRDDFGAVITTLEERIAADGGRGASGEPLGVAPLLVEGYLGAGRADDARALADRFASTPSIGGRIDALIARCRGLTADDHNAAIEAFEAAIAAHTDAFDEPFEIARTELHYGSRLRRSGERVAARAQLRSALNRFDRAGLTLWARRAADELAATGETARKRRPVAVEPLTSQETRVALLVGRGMTNREAAASLFLSPKTVEHHLSSIYRKRGLRSRTELARAMTHAPDDDG
jgi:DNA-binding CsgD family transcriptional regulator